jgi:hypothetical protein
MSSRSKVLVSQRFPELAKVAGAYDCDRCGDMASVDDEDIFDLSGDIEEIAQKLVDRLGQLDCEKLVRSLVKKINI